VKIFLEWVFWRQGSGFSMSTSGYNTIPTGTQLLGMPDEGFGSLGFTHDEVCVCVCVCVCVYVDACVYVCMYGCVYVYVHKPCPT